MSVLHAFALDRLGLVVSDIYFVDPRPDEGQEGAERGVRLELRVLDAERTSASHYASRPVTFGRPAWRVDLLGAASSPPGTLDRAHHHPVFDGWEPSDRHFEPDLTADPVGWLDRELGDLATVLVRAGLPPAEYEADIRAMASAVPAVLVRVGELLSGVAAGTLAVAPDDGGVEAVRVGWL